METGTRIKMQGARKKEKGKRKRQKFETIRN
jgi:hypothetical protein